MPKSSYQGASRNPSTYQFGFDQTYVSKIEVEAHMLRAQAISNIISEITSDIATLFSTAAQWVAIKVERNRQRNTLYALDDHMLSDIGITRGEIDGIINGTIKLDRGQSVPANITTLKQPKTETTERKQHDDTTIAA